MSPNEKKLDSSFDLTKIDSLREKFEDLFELGDDADVTTFIANAITTYGQLGHLTSQGLSFYVGKQSVGELNPIQFPFEDIEGLVGPTIKLKKITKS